MFFSSGIGGSSIFLARLLLVDDLFVGLDHPERGVFLVPVVQLRVANALVGHDRLRQLARVVERVGGERRELVAALRVRVGDQILLVELRGGRRRASCTRRASWCPSGSRATCPCTPGRRRGRWWPPSGGHPRRAVRATASASGLSLLCSYQSLPLAYAAAERLALLGGGDQVAVLLVGVDDPVLHPGASE